MMSDTGSYRSDNEDTLRRTVTPARADTVSFVNVRLCTQHEMKLKNFACRSGKLYFHLTSPILVVLVQNYSIQFNNTEIR